MPDNPSGQLSTSNGIAALRWLVTLCRRDQVPDPNSTGVAESFVPLADVHADIQPTYPTTYYNSAQVDIPITHLVRVRWTDYVENTHVIFRTTTRPTDGTLRTELFRVRRTKEIGGRKRFCEFEVELEKIATTQGDTNAERESVFAEGQAVYH